MKKYFEGYEPKIFIKTINQDFVCSICSNIVRSPRECKVCGTLFCQTCLKQWESRNKGNQNNYMINNSVTELKECPFRCKNKSDVHESIMKPVGKVIKNIVNSFEVKCPNKDCLKIMTLEQYEEHESICNLPKCQNPKCGKGSEKLINYKEDKSSVEMKFCTEMCKYSFVFQQLVKTHKPDELSDWFHNFATNTVNDIVHRDCEKRINNLKNMVKVSSGNTEISFKDIDYTSEITIFKWDNNKKGVGIQIYNDGEGLLLNESCYIFRSIIASQPFESGINYFEVIADRRTENELKIGVSKSTNFNYDTSFSDYNFGWAFYGIGQLRHSNNAAGDVYGKKFKKSGTLGVFLDMDKGILSFALDGEYFGCAFQSEDLKTGPIYAAVSLLHVGGCILQTGLPAPSYFFSDY